MNTKYINAKAAKFRELDKRLSLDVALTEAILEQVIIDLDERGKIFKARLIDKP